MAKIRTFIAIKIAFTPKIQDLFETLKKELRGEHIKWVSPDNLHITLKFIGDTDDRKIPLIVKRLAAAANIAKPFPLKVVGCGVFPNPKRARVVWLGLQYPEILDRLKDEIEELLAYIVPVDEKDFHPHLTLGRVKSPLVHPDRLVALLTKMKDAEAEELLIDEFVLMQSEISREGPVYTPLKKFSLRKEE